MLKQIFTVILGFFLIISFVIFISLITLLFGVKYYTQFTDSADTFESSLKSKKNQNLYTTQIENDWQSYKEQNTYFNDYFWDFPNTKVSSNLQNKLDNIELETQKDLTQKMGEYKLKIEKTNKYLETKMTMD